MREDLLHFIWKYKKLQLKDLRTNDNHPLIIESVGRHNQLSGPDFFNAKIKIGNQLWAGNVEMHLKSSDWYAHNHETDANYDNVILHVVWEDDASVFRKDNTIIPTLELKNIISPVTLNYYRKLFSSKKNRFINCEKDIALVSDFEVSNWLERLYFERLEQKSTLVFKILEESKNDWEHVLFLLLLKNFGSKVNGESFFNLGHNIGYSVFKKVCDTTQKAESLLFGCAGLLNDKDITDSYFLDLKNEFDFLKSKFNMDEFYGIKPNFFRLRPSNFPTIRLSQFANLYATNRTLFSKLMNCKSLMEFYEVFNINASNYWDDHFTFGKISKKSKKRLTKSFIDLIVVNTILPLKFCYAKHQGKDENDDILSIVLALEREKNSVIDSFEKLDIKIKDAKESQAILQLYNEYCTKNKCLQCAIGSNLLNRNS